MTSSTVVHRTVTPAGRPARAVGLLVGVALVAGAVVLSILFGSGEGLSATTAWHSLWASSSDLASSGDLLRANDIVFSQRIPRTVLGILAGAALGAAGALVQGHTRNPLADPGLLGVNGGASLAVVLGVFVFGVGSPWSQMWLGMAGALVASAAVFLLAAGGRGASPLALVLFGVGISAFLVAATSAVVLVDVESMDVWRYWNVGSTAGRDWNVVGAAAPFIVIGLIAALAGGYFLNVLSLGDSMARSLGSRVRAIRAGGIATVAVLAGTATAACGPIAFLGLVVPHLARVFSGPDYRFLVPCAALFGAGLAVICDVAGRVIGSPGELPVSLMLAIVGVPWFVVVLRRRKLVEA